MIDSGGGKVVSADGRLELTIPPGVFTTATEVGIQPITNTSPNGIGRAYRLTPEGTTFTQPVTVTLHLDTVQTMGIDSTFLVSQHADGLWYSQPHQARDAAAQTVSVPAKHFSDWAVAQTVLLSPQQTRVRTSQGANFVPKILMVKLDDDELANPIGDELALPVPQPLDGQINADHSWQVNAVNGGNTTVGLIVDNKSTGDFTAPSTPPSPSTVTVTITVQLGKSKVIAPAQVAIYAQETWNGTSHITMTNGTVVDATFTFTESFRQGATVNLNVKQGTVHVHVPDTLPNGCTQTVNPTEFSIGPNDGLMTVTYDLSTGFDNPMVAGMGTTVWLATYTVTCANGSNSMPAGLQAEWWPSVPGAPTPVEASNGVYDNVVQSPTASGNVHLIRK
jgi:hypothetical protein